MSIDDWFLNYYEGLTLKHCMERIEENHKGCIFVLDASRRAIGLLTDGDIRRALLAGATSDSLAHKFINTRFKSLSPVASREQILKLLDHEFRFVPIVRDGVIERIITREDLHYSETTSLIARAKAPARISFGGGGTDLTSFFVEHGGAVLNATINLYSHCTLKRREDDLVVIRSVDFNQEITCRLGELKYNGSLDLIKAGLRLLKPDFGFELSIVGDFPPNSGLGGSSVVLGAMIGCFNQYRDDKLTRYEIAEMAFQAERIELGFPGGWQDQYAAVFGGFNFMEFRNDQNQVYSLKVPSEVIDELEERLVICYSGKKHASQNILSEQKKSMAKDKNIISYAHRTREIAYEMKSSLLRGQIDQLGKLLHEAWGLKKTFSTSITDKELDEIYDAAMANGAVGGKILGAGGGGHFLFQSDAATKPQLIRHLRSQGLQVREFSFDDRGMRSWTIRDSV